MPFDSIDGTPATLADWCSLDFETRSDAPLPKIGVYRYCESPNTDAWCLGYAFDFAPVRLWQMGEPFPHALLLHLQRGGKFRAWSAQFEWAIWNYIMHVRHGWPRMRREQLHCTQAQALNMGLPMALDKTAEALGLTVGKDREGHKLMMQMCQPRLRQPNGSCLWHDDQGKRDRLGAYCVRDVETERAIGIRVRPMSDRERAIWLLDQEINERGMRLDKDLIRSGMAMVEKATRKLDQDVKKLTDGLVENPRKRIQLVQWLHQHGDLTEVDSIDKHAVAALLRRDDLDGTVRAVLTIRRESAKSSTAKLNVMQRAVCKDGRIRGLLQYYGARQTGRWAGRLLQPHNFPKGHIEADALEGIVADVKMDDIEFVDVLHGPPLDVMSSLLRGCIIPSDGCDFLVVDFAAIEARVVAWLAGQRDLVNLFATGGDPYRVMGGKVYGKDPRDVTSDERWLGKQLILGCGFNQGWESFMLRLEKEGLAVTETFAQQAISDYRDSNSHIRDYWGQMQEGAMAAIRAPGTTFKNNRISFLVKNSVLYMRLPSGRYLAYLRPTIETVTTIRQGKPWTREQIFYWGVDPITYQWAKLYTYGGKLTENAVQAIARDLLADAMLRMQLTIYRAIVLHVHDEVAAEVPHGVGSVEEIEAVAALLPEYADGLPLAVKGWRGPRYRKG